MSPKISKNKIPLSINVQRDALYNPGCYEPLRKFP